MEAEDIDEFRDIGQGELELFRTLGLPVVQIQLDHPDSVHSFLNYGHLLHEHGLHIDSQSFDRVLSDRFGETDALNAIFVNCLIDTIVSFFVGSDVSAGQVAELILTTTRAPCQQYRSGTHAEKRIGKQHGLFVTSVKVLS